MASLFTKSFQNALGKGLERFLSEQSETSTLEVGIDTVPMRGWEGRPDIWIMRKARLGSNRILAIEIEHLSKATQASTNIEQVVKWVNGGITRKSSLIHLINLESNLTDSKCTDLLHYGYKTRSKRFNYDFRIYEVTDYRASIQLADRLINDYDFQSLLWQNLMFLGLINKF